MLKYFVKFLLAVFEDLNFHPPLLIKTPTQRASDLGDFPVTIRQRGLDACLTPPRDLLQDNLGVGW